MDTRPFFSFIVPCCDVEPYIEDCLQSILKQSFQDWECIINIETSKDGTEEIIRKKTVGDPRFRIFTGPRTGSCSVSRNKGIDVASGEYIIFLDGDDSISDGCLERLHTKISANPGADLYPCALIVQCEIKDKKQIAALKARNRMWFLSDGLIVDNYRMDVSGEMSGVDAIIGVKSYNPMLQMTIHRRQFLLDHDLKCIGGVRYQDQDFSRRAFLLAKRVIPLHEPYYIYRVHPNSIQTIAKSETEFLKDWGVILKSLLLFHEKLSRESHFDARITTILRRHLIRALIKRFFSIQCQKEIPREKRAEYLKDIFEDNFDAFDHMMASAPFDLSTEARLVRIFVKHVHLRWIVDLSFRVFFILFSVFVCFSSRKEMHELKHNASKTISNSEDEE